MEGPVQWAALIFICAIALGAIGIAWRARGILAEIQTEQALQASYRRHLQNNFDMHKIAAAEDHDKLIRTEAEVQRLAKIVNGKH